MAPGEGRSGAGGRAGWRGGRAAGGTGASAGAAKPATGWAAKKGHEGEVLVWKFRAKLAAWAVVGLALCVVLYYWLRTPKSTPYIVAVLTEYKFPLPPNAWALDDANAIADQISQGGAQSNRDAPLSTKPERRIAWEYDGKAWLEKLRIQVRDAANIKWYHTEARGPGDGVVIVHLSGHGVVDSKGTPCLLLPQGSEDEDLFDPKQNGDFHQDRNRLIPLRELFETLFSNKNKSEDAIVPDRVVKLVVLDASRIDTAWELGVLYNDFTEELSQVVAALDVSNLFVLNSTAAGEIGWASPELGGSVFGFFVKRGLTGYADGSTGVSRDKFISVDELHRFVEREVSKWVANYRSDRQRPTLFATANSDAAKPLVEYGAQMLDRPEPGVTERDARVKEVSQRLAAVYERGWKHHPRLNGSAVRDRPLRLRRFEAKLLRAEQLAMGGEAYRERFSEAMAEIDELRKALETQPQEPIAPNSVQLAKTLGGLPAEKHNEISAKVKAKLDGVAKAPEVEVSRENYIYRAASAWDRLAGQATAALAMSEVARVLDQVVPVRDNAWELKSEPVEVHFLRMLRAHVDPAVEQSASDIGAAVRRRAMAERLAAPADGRVHYWLRATLDRADDERRLAEDRLFLGGPGVAQSRTTGASADATFRRADDLHKALATAYALRDRAWLQIPKLVRYYARRLPTAGPQNEGNEDAQILPLLALRDQIQAAVAEFENWKPDELGMFDPQRVTDLEQQLATLATQLNNANSRLATQLAQVRGGSDDLDRRRVHDRLQTTLVTGPKRQELHGHWAELCQKYTFAAEGAGHEQVSATAVTATVPAADAASPLLARTLDWPQKWRDHPALKLLAVPRSLPPEATVYTPAGLRGDGAKLRARLHQLQQDVKSLVKPEGDLALYTTTRPPDSRNRLDQADRNLRAAAELVNCSLRPSDLEPAEGLRQFDRQRLLLWHYQRALDDFWGPLPGSGDPTPFFYTATNQLLTVARRQLDAPQKTDLAAPIVARSDAAKDGLRAWFEAAYRQIRVDAAGEKHAPHQVKMRQDAARDLPPGVATYYMVRQRGALRRGQIEVDPLGTSLEVRSRQQSPASDKPAEYSLRNVAGLLGRANEQSLWGQLLYRGHLFTSNDARLDLTRFECLRKYEFEPPQYPSPVIVVKGTERPRAIMIVFDCSASMIARLGGGKTRMDVAKEVLLNVLDDLKTTDPTAHVGLRLYSHRVAYPTSGVELLPSPLGKEQGVDKLRPPDDVQRVVDLQPVAKAVPEITAVIRKVEPWGDTPLYLAIREAITSDFPETIDGKKVNRSLLVITDGANWQRKSDPLQDKSKIVTHTQLRDVLAAHRTRFSEDHVRLHVVGFDIDESKFEPSTDHINKGNIAELKSVLPAIDGDYIPVGGGRVEAAQLQLLNTLKLRLGIFPFRIKSLDGPSDADAPVAAASDPKRQRLDEALRLNQEYVMLDVPENRLRRYAIRFDSPRGTSAAPVQEFPFEIRGRGERIVLTVRESRLADNRYDRRLMQNVIIDGVDYNAGRNVEIGEVEGPQGLPLQVIPLRPRWTAAGVEFRVYIRSKNYFAASPTPVEALAEVTALIQGDAQLDKYLIHDVKFESEQPFPLLSFVAPKWPIEAQEARISLWLKYPQPTDSLPKFEAGTTQTRRFEVGGAEVAFDVRPDGNEAANNFWVKVTELHPPLAKTLDKLHVMMQDRPSRVSRCYVSDGRTVIHQFFYDGRADLTLDALRRFNVVVTEVDQMKQGAVQTPDRLPIQIRVPRPNER